MAEPETQSLEILFEQLSPEGRIIAIINALERRLIDKPEYLREAIEYLKGKKYVECLSQAARLAKKFGLEETATQLYGEVISHYEHEGNLLYAAKTAEEGGDLERALQIYQNMLEKCKGHSTVYSRILRGASELAIKVGSVDKAILFLEKSGNYKKAAALAEESGDTERALKIYEGMPPRPLVGLKFKLELAEKAGDTERVEQIKKELYEAKIVYFSETTNSFEEAIQLAKEAGDTKRANEIYQKVINQIRKAKWEFGKGARLAKSFGDKETEKEFYDKAILEYEKNGWYVDATNLAEEFGDTERADTYRTLRESFKLKLK